MWITGGHGYEQAMELARDVLRKNQISGPAVPIFDICKTLNVRITLKGPAGRPATANRETRTIFHSKMSVERASFYVAHELGHLLLSDYFAEQSFNTFAECLLMPEEWIMADVDRMSEYELRARYRVSVNVLRKRLRHLRFLHDSQNPVFTRVS